MTSVSINREASDKTKGFRLQKVRAIELMLKSINKDTDSVFYTAIENVEDVSHWHVEDSSQKNYYEEDKNYAADGKFTIHSPAVKNTLVSFFDIYANQLKNSEHVYLGFYTTTGVGKERKHTLDNGVTIELPDEPLLELLASKKDLKDIVVTAIHEVLKEEYERQYPNQDNRGHLQTLNQQSISQLRTFLGRITWKFGQDDEISLKKTVLDLIKTSPLHNVNHANKEEIIFSLLMEKLDEKQNKTNLVEKLVHSSDVKLIFKQAESELPGLVMDPAWQELERLQLEITDKRSLIDKIEAVAKDYPKNKFQHLARKACRSKKEQSDSNKTVLSLKYRVFEACNDYFFENDRKPNLTVNEVDSLFSDLFNESVESIDELKKDYHYSLSNKKLIEGIVLDLFDTCFLAFDEKENDK